MQNILTLHKEYIEIINDLKKIKVSLPQKEITDYKTKSLMIDGSSKIELLDDKLSAIDIVPSQNVLEEWNVMSYDESIAKYKCLEGTGFHTAHALTYLGEDDYIPIGLLTFYFYTASKKISDDAAFIKYTEDMDLESKRDYLNDRIKFMLENVPPNSILLIDGPLIGGDGYVIMVKAIEELHKKNIIPVFFVKNSNSNLIVESISEIRKDYNSDMHWSYELLKEGQRTSFVKYVDARNEENSKVFTYLKAFNKSPQRVEFHGSTYQKYIGEIDEIINAIYYLLLAQGNKNPQVRPIAIAEKFAREFIRVSNMDDYFFGYGFVPTMNQERFG